jgi:hypothetical protein
MSLLLSLPFSLGYWQGRTGSKIETSVGIEKDVEITGETPESRNFVAEETVSFMSEITQCGLSGRWLLPINH